MPTTCLSVLPIAAPLSDMQNRHFANSMRVHAIVSPDNRPTDYLAAPENKGEAKNGHWIGLHFCKFCQASHYD